MPGTRSFITIVTGLEFVAGEANGRRTLTIRDPSTSTFSPRSEAAAWVEQQAQPDYAGLGFDERLGLLVDAEAPRSLPGAPQSAYGSTVSERSSSVTTVSLVIVNSSV